MDFYHLDNGHPPHRLDAQMAELPTDGFVWIDCVRTEAQGWERTIERLLKLTIDSQHVDDSHNPQHPSFFDGTCDYDMVIFQGLGPGETPLPIETRSTAMFIFPRVLVTVRATDSLSVLRVREKLFDGRLKAPGSALKLAQRGYVMETGSITMTDDAKKLLEEERVKSAYLGDGRQKSPGSPLRLAHLILDAIVDRFLHIREPMAQRLTQLQDDLLDPREPMEDWRALLAGRKQARKLEALCEAQIEALDAWRRNSIHDWDGGFEVRMRDLNEHVHRVLGYATGQERDLEAAVELHFASVAHRTNKIVRTLTVLSAIFFPLTLITGIYGMNFEYMPELHWEHGYFYALGMLITIGGSLYWYFRSHKYL